MIDEYLQAINDAEHEVSIGGIDIAVGMLRTLRRDFPASYAMIWLDTMIEDPTAPRWDALRIEVLAAAGALLGAHAAKDARRIAQAKTAAQHPRASKWDTFRANLADDLAEIVAGPEDTADILAAELQALWTSRGLIEVPPRSTIIRWVQKT